MATKQQISKMTATLVEFQEGFEELSSEVRQWVIQNGREAIKVTNSALTNHVKIGRGVSLVSLSDVIIIFNVSATTKKFVAKDNFKVDISESARVKISKINDKFVELFLPKIEDNFNGSIIIGRELNEPCRDADILATLSTVNMGRVTLTEIFAMMESECLATNGWANIFYVQDHFGLTHPIAISWHNGWIIEAFNMAYPVNWSAENLVFSRHLPAPLKAA